MPSLPAILEYVQRRLRPSLSGVVTDALLLERFLAERDEAAFELLMWRHGPMVFGVCRRILQHAQDAEDAFQATFLMLARRAATIGRRNSVGGWLYMVAYRIALRARTRSARRGRIEKPMEVLPIDDKSADPADVAAWRELRHILDAELSRIPEKYRTAFILCHLEGKTCDEAAEHLGCPRGTVQSRVGRARERLRQRLASRGWMPASSPLTSLLEQHGAALGQMSPVLLHATVPVALLVAFGRAFAGAVSDTVVELMNESLAASRLSRLRYLAILALLGLFGSGAVAWGMRSSRETPAVRVTGGGCAMPSCHGSPKPPSPPVLGPPLVGGTVPR